MFLRTSRAPRIAILLIIILGVGLSSALSARSASAPFRSGNGITLQAGQLLPIYSGHGGAGGLALASNKDSSSTYRRG
jgi:hypothetical protein